MLLVQILVQVVESQKIRLRDIQALTFRKGLQTASRRTYSVSQLVCVGDVCPTNILPDVVQCQNQGWDGQEVQWKCTSELDNAIKFKKTTVICEGYARQGDENVLVGSCGLEYSLYKNPNYNEGNFGFYDSHYSYEEPSKIGGQKLFLIILIIVLMYLIYNWLNRPRGYAPPATSAPDEDGYQGRQSFPPRFKADTSRNTSNPYEPGFWTGLGVGGLLGNLLSRGRRDTQSNSRVYSSEPAYGSSYRSYSTTTGGTRQRSERSSAGQSGSRTTSTGYGGSRTR